MIEAAKLLGIQGLTEAGNIDGLEAKKENTAWKPESEGTRFNHNSIGSTVTNGQLLKEEVEEDEEEAETRDKAAVEMAKPDSSNNLIFPALHQAAPVFPLALANWPLGLDLSQHLGINQGRRRKSSPTAVRSPKITSPHSSTSTTSSSSSNQVNSSSNAYQHYPPGEDPTRPFACSTCKSEENLKLFLISELHLTLGPKRFRMKHHLKEHTLIHSGEVNGGNI